MRSAEAPSTAVEEPNIRREERAVADGTLTTLEVMEGFVSIIVHSSLNMVSSYARMRVFYASSEMMIYASVLIRLVL